MDFAKTMVERLNPSALHFKSIEVEAFRPIRELAVEFAHHNVITGFHGTGKTSLLHLLAGVAGNQNSSDLIADEPIGRLKVVLGAGNEEFVFEARDRFDRNALDEFKATLPNGKRANLATTDHYIEQYQYGDINYDTFQACLNEFLARTRNNIMVFPNPGVSVKTQPGSGISQAIRLFLVNAMEGGPLLLEHPETSLDHRNKILCSMMLCTAEKQTIAVTYADEWVSKVHKNIDLDKIKVDK